MLNMRILGEQPEPTGLIRGHEISDFCYRTRDAGAFEKGCELVEQFVADLTFTPSDSEYSVIDDPQQISLGECEDTGKFPGMNTLVLQLEKLGWFAKSVDYRVAEFDAEFARAFNSAVSSPENINEDGSVNWNYVDADLYSSDHRPSCDVQYYQLFDSIAAQYDLANGIVQ